MEFSQAEQTNNENYLVATVREEIDSDGTLFVAKSIKPDEIIGIDFAVTKKDKAAIDF